MKYYAIFRLNNLQDLLYYSNLELTQKGRSVVYVALF